MKTAVAFLTKSPHKNTVLFAKEVSNVGFDTFIICDDKQEHDVVNDGIISIEDELCQKWGYVNSNISSTATHIKKNPIAWDKMLLFFCQFATEYDFVWVFEDDCFIPSVEVIQNLHLKYRNFHLVTPNNFQNDGKAMDWHWRDIYPKIKGPYAYSMVCACGISRDVLNEVKKYKEREGTLFYIEVMFNTLALQKGLKVIDAFELKSIVWQGDWGLNEFILLPNNIFHPRKDIHNHYVLRGYIKYAKQNEYKPKNNLPHFLKNEQSNS
jgi:hypothetical protein